MDIYRQAARTLPQDVPSASAPGLANIFRKTTLHRKLAIPILQFCRGAMDVLDDVDEFQPNAYRTSR